MKDLFLYLGLAVWCVALAPSTSARAAEPCTAIKDAKVMLPNGGSKVATVTIASGKITAVGSQPMDGCNVIAGTGQVLTPGFIETQSSLGLVEVSLEDTSNDTKMVGKHGPSTPIRASFQVFEGYNPNSSLIAVARRAGITSSILLPRGGTVSGQAAWVDLSGSTQKKAVQSEAIAMVATVGQSSGSRATVFHRLRDFFEEALEFEASASDWKKNRTRPFERVRELRAVLPVLKGTMPLIVTAHRASDIERVIALAKKFSLKVVIAGGAEAWLLKDALAAEKIPVIVDPESNGPGSFDQIHGRANNAALLEAAGVPLILSSFSSHNARKLSQMAGTSVREGLPYAAALRAITQTPAEVFGLQGLGKIEPGAVANVVLWSGDPFELGSKPNHVWIDGRATSLKSRQTFLRDRYMSLPVRR